MRRSLRYLVQRRNSYRESNIHAKVWTGVHLDYNDGDAYQSSIPEPGSVFVSIDVTFIENCIAMARIDHLPKWKKVVKATKTISN